MLIEQTFDLKKYEAAVGVKYEAAIRSHLRESALREWQYRLKPGDKLPRGKFFKGKRAGKPFIMMDEAPLIMNESFAVINSQARRACLRIDMRTLAEPS